MFKTYKYVICRKTKTMTLKVKNTKTEQTMLIITTIVINDDNNDKNNSANL